MPIALGAHDHGVAVTASGLASLDERIEGSCRHAGGDVFICHGELVALPSFANLPLGCAEQASTITRLGTPRC